MPDQITVKMDPNSNKTYPLCPPGPQHAVCVDVIDLGWTADQYQNQPIRVIRKAVLVFQTDEQSPESGKRFEPSAEFTIEQELVDDDGTVKVVTTFGARSKLRQFLDKWRAKDYTDEEAKAGAPLHKLVGVNAMLNIMHKQSKANPDRTYAVIEGATGIPKALPKIQPADYTRSEHWEKRKAEYAEKLAAYRATHTGGAAVNMDELPPALQDPDDDLPF